MDVQIEILVILGGIILIGGLALLLFLHLILAKRRYKPENDKGKLGEENRDKLRAESSRTSGTDGGNGEETNGSAGLDQFTERTILQTTSSDLPRKNVRSSRGVNAFTRRRFGG